MTKDYIDQIIKENLKQKELNTKVIFIHIPMLKNITDSVFIPKLIHVLNELEKLDIFS